MTTIPTRLHTHATRDMKRRGIRPLVCLISTPGGHLTELEPIARHLGDLETMLVTTKSPHSESVLTELPRRYILRIQRNPVALLVNVLQSMAIAMKQRPDLVISTGAGETIPLMFVAAVLGIPLVFVETQARVHMPSLTGRLIRRWADLVIVHWPPLLRFYPQAVLAAPGIQPSPGGPDLPPIPSIVVLTGSGTRGFDGPLKIIDGLVREGKLSRKVFAQVGASRYTPRGFPYARFLPHGELLERIRSADVVVTHDGAGSIMESLAAGKPTIVIPREAARGELIYRSTAELAKCLAEVGWVVLVTNPLLLPDVIEKLRRSPREVKSSSEPPSWRVILEFLKRAGLDQR